MGSRFGRKKRQKMREEIALRDKKIEREQKKVAFLEEKLERIVNEYDHIVNVRFRQDIPPMHPSNIIDISIKIPELRYQYMLDSRRDRLRVDQVAHLGREVNIISEKVMRPLRDMLMLQMSKAISEANNDEFRPQ